MSELFDVMIVEDELIVRQWFITKVRWGQLGMRVVADAADGRQALAAWREHRPQIVVTDLRMPVMDGISLVREIRLEDAMTRIIIITCLEDFELARQAIELDVTAYVLKVTSEIDEIESALRRAAAAYRQLCGEETESHAGAGPEEDDLPARVQAALNYMRDNFAQDISLEGIAQTVGVTPNYLGHMLMKRYGVSFTDEVNRLRIQRAKHLLADPALRVYEIADNVGYRNVNYFFRLFKRVTGRTPNEFRQDLFRKGDGV